MAKEIKRHILNLLEKKILDVGKAAEKEFAVIIDQYCGNIGLVLVWDGLNHSICSVKYNFQDGYFTLALFDKRGEKILTREVTEMQPKGLELFINELTKELQKVIDGH